MTLTRGRIVAVAIVAALMLGYTLFGFFGVPRLLRSHATAFIADTYGRKLEMGEIQFNPFTLVLEVESLSFPDAEGQPLVGFRSLLVNLNATSLFKLAPSFAAIELTEPFTNVVIREDGSLNLVDLARPFAEPAAPATPAAKPQPLAIEVLRVSAGTIEFEDRARASVFRTRLTPINFVLNDFSTTGTAGNAYSLRAASAADERLRWDGTFAMTPFASQGRFEVTNLKATTLWSYLRDALAFEITSGMIHVAGGYDLGAGDAGITLRVDDVSATDVALHAPGHPEDVKLPKLQVTNTKLDLNRRRVDMEKISVSGAAVNARREPAGKVNLLALLGPARPPAPVQKAASAPAWVLSAPDIEVDGASVDIEDRLVQPAAAFKLAPIDVKLNGYSNAPGTTVRVDARIGIDGRASLTAKGEIVPDKSTASMRVDLRDFRLPSIQPYLGAYTQMTLSNGTLNAGLDANLVASGAFGIKGDIDAVKVHTIDNGLKQEFITWDRLRLSGIDYASEPARLRIATVAADAPYVRLIIAPDQTTNVSKVLSAKSGSNPAPIAKAATPPPLRMSIGAVRIANGAANFADFWIQPNYAVNLQNMNGSILGLSSDPKSRARVQFEGKVDRYAPAKIDGDINLLSAALYTDLKVSFKGVEMTSVTPYSGRFAGYKIEKGKLSIDVAYLVENRTLNAKQKFIIDQLELGERVESEDAVRLPLKLAVALLKDRDGVIDIDLPMSGSLDDPHFRMGPLIWKAFIGLLTKAATAPFALLGSLFGGGEEMNLIEFDAGSATLDAAASQKLASIGKALTERPALKLEVPTSYSPQIDGEVIASQRLDALLRALPKADDAALIDPTRRFELLVMQYQADLGARTPLPPAALALDATRKSDRDPAAFPAANLELEQAVAGKHAIGDGDLEQLGQARARAIQDALLGSGTLDAARVFVMGANPVAKTENRKVRVELSLK